MTERFCGICEFWMQTGMEDSGIRAADGKGNWFYAVGTCEHPDNTRPDWQWPSWSSCYLHKAARKRRVEVVSK